MFKLIRVYCTDCYINAFVKYKRKYYIVSDNGYGCYIYKSDSKGNITNYLQIANIDNVMLGDIVRDGTCFSENLKKNKSFFLTR